jgi:hypothetical protein
VNKSDETCSIKKGGELQPDTRLGALLALHYTQPALEDHDHAATDTESGKWPTLSLVLRKSFRSATD